MADALDQNFTYLLPGLSIGFSGLSYNKRSMATCIRGQLSWILDSQLRDTAKASLMLPDGSYCRKHSAVPFDSQDTFMQQHPHIPAAAAGAPRAEDGDGGGDDSPAADGQRLCGGARCESESGLERDEAGAGAYAGDRPAARAGRFGGVGEHDIGV